MFIKLILLTIITIIVWVIHNRILTNTGLFHEISSAKYNNESTITKVFSIVVLVFFNIMLIIFEIFIGVNIMHHSNIMLFMVGVIIQLCLSYWMFMSKLSFNAYFCDIFYTGNLYPMIMVIVHGTILLIGMQCVVMGSSINDVYIVSFMDFFRIVFIPIGMYATYFLSNMFMKPPMIDKYESCKDKYIAHINNCNKSYLNIIHITTMVTSMIVVSVILGKLFI